MKSVGVELGFSAESISPIHEGICASPAIEREVILGGQAVDGVETITSFVYGEPAAYERLVEGLEAVRDYDVAPTDDGFFLYLRRALGEGGTSLVSALSRETVVVVPPIEVRSDRTIRLTLVGHPSDLASVVEYVGDGLTLEVAWVSDDVTVEETPVSGRQFEALEAAWDVGYYDVPRRGGVEAVADELDCAVSTASELLRRGEAGLVGRALEGGPGGERGGP